jgi:hypothetical protein
MVTYYECSRRQRHIVLRRSVKQQTARLPVCQTLPIRERDRNFYKGISRTNCNREDSNNAMSGT